MEEARFRERVLHPCRMIYQVRGETLVIAVVVRAERLLVPDLLEH
jgi:hypothetical protein